MESLRRKNPRVTNNFREIDVYPRQSELFDDHILLRENIRKGSFEDVNHYLDVHFKLLREDFVSSLREGIKNYRLGKPTVLEIYEKVRIQKSVTKRGKGSVVAHLEEFYFHNRTTKQFMNGSLLIFTNDSFKTMFLAKVVQRDITDLKKGEVRIELVKNYDEIFIMQNSTYMMAECTVYFEPYFQVLTVLKSIQLGEFPMEKYIIKIDTIPQMPGYLRNGDLKIAGDTVVPQTWVETATSLEGLNPSQFNAFKAALTQEFVVIQGPPGTGKTFLGLKIVETLIKNEHLWYSNSPILIISHKNQALDQFMEGLIPVTHRLVRVGNNSRSAKLARYTLKTLLKQEIPTISRSGERMRIISTELNIMRNALVVAMTTTVAAKMKDVLQDLQSPIVVVEEAAEVLEAHIVAALTKHCQHLILLGDHQQLQPATANIKIAQDYHLDLSLFERMVLNGVQCYQLEVQHRMRPEISSVLKATVYPFLQDHDSVKNRPSVPGVTKNIFFIDHSHEEKPSNVTSKKNCHEAKFMIAFARYLILNGCNPETTVILTTYSGQVFEMEMERRALMDRELLDGMKISTLDAFQGQEADVILLSLVRSADLGFLAVENRICVALSRARNGFYMMGNMELLARCSKQWRTIKESLKDQEAIGESLVLGCQLHEGNETSSVKEAEDFLTVPSEGCLKKCGLQLPCGHLCQTRCHVLDTQHGECRDICARKICKEHDDEICLKQCCDECRPCKNVVTKAFDCGHTVLTLCNITKCSKC